MNSIALSILATLEEHKEVRGTDELAKLVGANVQDLMPNVFALSEFGMIDVLKSKGGRGKKTIYRNAVIFTVKQKRIA